MALGTLRFTLLVMHVLIEARSLSSSQGVKTYTQQLITHLLAAKRHQYTVVYDAARYRGTFPAAHEVVLPLRHEILLPWWLHRQFPPLIKQEKPHVAHFTKADIPYRLTVPTVITIHDVIPLLLPSSQKLLQRWYWPRALHTAAKRSHHILTVSQASKRDIVAHLQVPADKVTVTSLAADSHHFSPALPPAVDHVRAKYNLSHPYFLFLGTWEPRKNIPSLLRAFAQVAPHLPHQLVLGGKKGWKHQAVLKTLARLPVRDRVRIIDYVPYQDLPALYSGADLFLWPSVYEGWGFPPLEAQACGTPVVVSDGGALPEVVGTAGIVVPFSADSVPARLNDPDFERRFGEAILSLLHNPNHLQRLKSLTTVHARSFRWEDLATATTNVYEQVAAL